MQLAETEFDVGVLVGRFQVHDLHAAHRALIQYVCDRHEKVIIFLGLSPLMVSSNNPLDFEARKQMILGEFPHVNVLYIKDQNSDEVWSSKLDDQISDLVSPGQSVVLYGGRDSFISHYSGRFDTRELTQTVFYSGTEQRKAIARSRVKASPEFRAGVIWASQSRFPAAYTTVDVAILKTTTEGAGAPVQQLLLGRKTNESRYRFIGGFTDPRSDSFESDAKREVREETGLEVGDLRYVGSMRVDDWRYRAEPDCIKTMLFTAKYLHGRPTPQDDIAEVKWFDFDTNGLDPELTDNVVLEHRPLMVMLWDNLY